MTSQFNKLVALFISDPSKAIMESQKLICSVSNFSSFKDFYNYHVEHTHLSTCQQEWVTPQVCIYCRDCALHKSSTLCLPCFVNGNHEGHNYIILTRTGRCSCGDASSWKPSGNCPNHGSSEEDKNNPDNYLDEKLRTALTDIIFKAAFSTLKQHSTENLQKASIICRFAMMFINLGNGFRRLISRSLTERIDFKSLLFNITAYSSKSNQLLQKFFLLLVNDKLFIKNFAVTSFSFLSQLILSGNDKLIFQSDNDSNISVWNKFWCNTLSTEGISYCIEQNQFDWVPLFIKVFNMSKDIFKFVENGKYNSFPSLLEILIRYFKNVTKFQSNEQTQDFFDKLVVQVLATGSQNSKKNDTTIFTSLLDYLEEDKFNPISDFNVLFYDLFSSFVKKEELKFDLLIDELDKSLDISPIFMIGKNLVGKGEKENENDRFVLRFLKSEKSENCEKFNGSNYLSFHNGSEIILHHTLFFSVAELFRNNNEARIRLTNLLSQEKYLPLRVKLGIATLKTILSFVCYHQSLTPMNNKGLISFYEYFSDVNLYSRYFTKFIPLFQMIIGLQSTTTNPKSDEFSLKEFFAFEMAREIGIFDDFTTKEYKDEDVNAKQKQMFFSFLYLSLLFVIERTLFNFNEMLYITEQIIFALKKGIRSIDDLSGEYDIRLFQDWSFMFGFNHILKKVATMSKTRNELESESENVKAEQQETSFYLKDGIEWNAISAINSMNEQMTLISNEITKDENSLFKLQSFQPEEEYFFLPNVDEKGDKIEKNPNSNSTNDKDPNIPSIKLKQFLFTPTVLAIVYSTLRNKENQSSCLDLNGHLAMNILVLIAQFVTEENENDSHSFDDSKSIVYESISDLIAQLKRVLFNYKVDDSGNALIENTLTKASFLSLLNLKLGLKNLQPKSFIDILLEKGKIGRSVLEKLSSFVHLEIPELPDEIQQDTKAANREKARKLKDSIMSHYRDVISSYQIDPTGDCGSISIDEDHDVCSICSVSKKNEIMCFPLYVYRTKFPFVVDKPPLVQDSSDANNSEMKRCPAGENYVLQFSLCMHHVHLECCEDISFYECPIDRSQKNSILPCIEAIPVSSIFKSLDTDSPELNTDSKLTQSVVTGINAFIERFVSFLSNGNKTPVYLIFVELIKSLSGLISTYELRLRNLPDCLDSEKSKALPRNLFLCAWIFYRLHKKSEMSAFDKSIEEKLTVFQKFIKRLIESDEIEGPTKEEFLSTTISSFINSSEFSASSDDLAKSIKRKILFLRRVCLSEHFLLNVNVSSSENVSLVIDWDDVFSIPNLSERYNVKFEVNDEFEFEFKPFSLSNLPKEFIQFAGAPFNFLMKSTKNIIAHSIIDYDFLINYYDELSGEIVATPSEEAKRIKRSLKGSNVDDMINFLEANYRNQNAPLLLILVAKYASQIILVDGNYFAFLPTFYVDKFGCVDEAYRRMQPLYLNEGKLERCIDQILSGDFSYSLESFSDY